MKLTYSLILGVIAGVLMVYGLLLPEKKVKAEEVKEVTQFGSERETHLYTKVEKTVDLPGFGDYQDLLASYAYNTCKKVITDTGKYSCENLVQTWNAENGGRRRDATNTSNSNGTHDGGLCQLNSAYHMPFIKSERFSNPLAQLDYCLQVRQDAKKKNVMPRYAYHVRHKRDRGIIFLNKQTQRDYYQVALEATKTRQKLEEKLPQAKNEEVLKRGECIKNKQCKE